MRIAVITGASSGIGQAFAVQMPYFYKELDEIWLIARNEERLCKTAGMCRGKTRILPMDLQDSDSIQRLKRLLVQMKPDVRMLVNSAGTGEKGNIRSMSEEQLETMLDLNCRTLMLVTQAVLPYMGKGSRIIQLASAATFAPQPGETVYAATKAFVLSYSRALNRECKKDGIIVTAVCPGPVDTALLAHLNGKDNSAHRNGTKAQDPLRRIVTVSASAVAKQALLDARKKKEMSVCGIWMKASRVFCSLIPHRILLDLMDLAGVTSKDTDHVSNGTDITSKDKGESL